MKARSRGSALSDLLCDFMHLGGDDKNMQKPTDCKWCDGETVKIPMVSGHKMPFLCNGCGSSLGYADHEWISDIINESHRYKRALEAIVEQHVESHEDAHEMQNIARSGLGT